MQLQGRSKALKGVAVVSVECSSYSSSHEAATVEKRTWESPVDH